MNHELKKIILASKSPRRQELLRLMDVDFRVVLKEVDESYPVGLNQQEYSPEES
jgi:septum formation protein